MIEINIELNDHFIQNWTLSLKFGVGQMDDDFESFLKLKTYKVFLNGLYSGHATSIK